MRYQHTNLLIRDTSIAGMTASFTRLAPQMALSLIRFDYIRFIGFSNPMTNGGAILANPVQKTVSQAETSVLMHVCVDGGLPHGLGLRYRR